MIALLALTLLACRVQATPLMLDFSQAAPARPELEIGVISGPTPTRSSVAPDLTSALKSFGIRHIRNNDYYDDRLDIEGILNCGGSTYPSWEGCDAAAESSYRWGPSDALMASFRAGGFEPMLRLGGEWENGDRHHDYKGPQNPTQEANWITAATKVALRYRGQYTYLNIWTEFPGPHFWDRDNAAFADFWARAYTAVKAAVPEARLGGPGFNAMATMQVSEGMPRSIASQFLATLYARHVRPDWLGWHIFNNDAAAYRKADLQYRALLDGTGAFSNVPWAGTGFFRSTELVADAIGTSPRMNPKEDLPPDAIADLHQGARGSATFASAFIALQSGSTTRAYVYRAGDPAPVRASAPNGTGLFASDGTPKKPAQAVRLWSALTAGWPKVVAVSAPNGGPCAVLAESPTGGHAVYVANASDAPVTVDSAGALTLSRARGAQMWLVDATHDGTTLTPMPAGALTLPAWSVTLVQIPA